MRSPPKSRGSSVPGQTSLYDDDDEAGTVVDASLFATPDIPDYPSIGQFGHFEILGRIARGGMAEIFLARERGEDGERRHVVLKRVLPEFEHNEDFLRMFLEEGQICTRLYHPNVCHVYECGEADGATFMTLEWVYGVPLRRVMRRAAETRSIPHPIAAKIFACVASALDYVHNAQGVHGKPLNIIHRDVSPHNIMVSWDGTVKLLDFGIAKTNTKGKDTDAGVLKGKYSYMSPEQARGKEIDCRSDIFALGICMYEAITGKPLYHRETVLNTLTAITDEPVPSARHIVADVPEELDAIIKKALAKDPADRFATAGELGDALNEYLVSSREYVEQTRIALYMDAIFEDADKDPLPSRASRGTGSHPSLNSASGQSGSFGPFGKAPRVELTPSEISIEGVEVASELAVTAESEELPHPFPGIPTPPPARSKKRALVIGLVVTLFIVLGVAVGMLTAFVLRS